VDTDYLSSREAQTTRGRERERERERESRKKRSSQSPCLIAFHPTTLEGRIHAARREEGLAWLRRNGCRPRNALQGLPQELKARNWNGENVKDLSRGLVKL